MYAVDIFLKHFETIYTLQIHKKLKQPKHKQKNTTNTTQKSKQSIMMKIYNTKRVNSYTSC